MHYVLQLVMHVMVVAYLLRQRFLSVIPTRLEVRHNALNRLRGHFRLGIGASASHPHTPPLRRLVVVVVFVVTSSSSTSSIFSTISSVSGLPRFLILGLGCGLLQLFQLGHLRLNRLDEGHDALAPA